MKMYRLRFYFTGAANFEYHPLNQDELGEVYSALKNHEPLTIAAANGRNIIINPDNVTFIEVQEL